MKKYVNRNMIRRDGWANSKSDKNYECSHTSSSTSVSTSTSEFDDDEVDFITTNLITSKLGDAITYNDTNGINSTNETDDDCNSIVSHISTKAYNRNARSAPQSNTVDDNVISVPRYTSNVSDDDDDDDESFATLEDDSDTEADQNSTVQFCPSDEEDDDDNDFIQSNYNGKNNNTIPKSTHDVSPQQHNDESNDNIQIDNDSMDYNDHSILHRPKTLPGLNNNFKVVCVSFMEYNIATSVACTILDEAIRMLRSGGVLYVIDKGGCTVKKHPMMRQWLTNVRDPTVKHLIYEIETRAILQCNGFVHTASSSADETNDDIVRWIGMKS
jgi:hypothetical protein